MSLKFLANFFKTDAVNAINSDFLQKNPFSFKKNYSLDNKKIYFQAWTVLFLVLITFALSWIWVNGKSLVTLGDGMHQHYPSLIYLGKWLRTMFLNFITLNFSIPLFDFNIGYGGDIITSLHYNIIGDPLALISFFVPVSLSENLYDFLIVLRLYLSGLAFSYYYFSMSKSKIGWGFPSLIGSLVYVFSMYPLSSIFAPFFLNQLIYLPIVLAGIEKIFNGKKPVLFIIAIAVSLCSNFYFFYPLSLLSAIYVIIRASFNKQILTNYKLFINLILYYSIGILIACFIFIPNLIALFQSQRFGVSHPVDLFYPLYMYREAFFAFFTMYYPFALPGVPLHFETAGFPLISLIAIVVIFLNWKKHWELKTAILILTLFSLLPIGGYIMNAFSYVSNRWMFGYTFLISFATAAVVPLLAKNKKIKIILFVFVTANIMYNSYFLYQKKDYKREFMPKTESYLTETENHFKIVKLLNDNSFFRVEDIQYYAFIEIRNLALNMRVKSVGFFYSLVNPDISLFNNEIELYNHQEHEAKNTDSRTIVGTLANVKYFVLPVGNKTYLPYGYGDEIARFTTFDGKEYGAYKNEYYLPFGYSYSNYLHRAAYERLGPVQKQETIFQTVVLDENIDSDFQSLNSLEFREQIHDFPVEYGNSLGGQSGKLIIPNNNFATTINYSGLPESETYLRFHNISFFGTGKYDGLSNIVMGVLENSAKASEVLDNRASWYSAKKDFSLNMGFNKESKNSIGIIFQRAGVFNCQSIQIISLPFEKEYSEQIEKLKKDCLQNTVEFTNGIKGSINLKENKILLFSIPYSKGWSAYVNGRKEKLLRANTIFCALPLKAGDYDIELKYFTPGLGIGIVLSLIGIVLLVFIWNRQIMHTVFTKKF